MDAVGVIERGLARNCCADRHDLHIGAGGGKAGEAGFENLQVILAGVKASGTVPCPTVIAKDEYLCFTQLVEQRRVVLLHKTVQRCIAFVATAGLIQIVTAAVQYYDVPIAGSQLIRNRKAQ